MKLRELLALPKVGHKQSRPKCKVNGGHSESNIAVQADADGQFEVRFRRSVTLPEDFSIILLYHDEDGDTRPIMRVNGDHGPHGNRDGTRIDGGPHLHRPSSSELERRPDELRRLYDPHHAVPLPRECLAPMWAWRVFKEHANLSVGSSIDAFFDSATMGSQLDLKEYDEP